MLVKANMLKIPYKDYVLRSLKQMVSKIPECRRLALAEEIRLKSCLFGCSDPEILRHAVAYLKGENPNATKD